MYKMLRARETWMDRSSCDVDSVQTSLHLHLDVSMKSPTMGEIEEIKDGRVVQEITSTSSPPALSPQSTHTEEMPEKKKKNVWQKFTTPGSVLQIIAAALLGIAIGLIVTTQVENVPDAAIALLAIPGQLWLRALRAVGE